MTDKLKYQVTKSQSSDGICSSLKRRFEVVRVQEVDSNSVDPPNYDSDDADDALPISIFDEQTKGHLQHRESFLKSEVITLSDVRRNYNDVLKTTELTLYEDDLKTKALKDVVIENIDRDTPVSDDAQEKSRAKLGTFFGVFLPCCQNIVGVIFFVRLPWIIGTSGVLEAFGIVSICNMMSILTAISMSAIATNGRVTAGGTYFMISRSLGPTFGGSVGFLFFCGTSISVAMYYLGTIETLLTYIAPQLAIYGKSTIDPGRYHDYRIYGSALLLCMATIVFIGVKCVSRFACFAILFLVAAILSVYTGLLVTASPETSEKLYLHVFSPKAGLELIVYAFPVTFFPEASLLILKIIETFSGPLPIAKLTFCKKFWFIFYWLTLFAIVLLPFIDFVTFRMCRVCLLGDRLVRYRVAHPNGTWQCNNNYGGSLYNAFCQTANESSCQRVFLENEAKLIPGVPGFKWSIFQDALYSHYSDEGMIPGTNIKSNPDVELVNDIGTNFFILLAIYFPSITGVESGSNYSGDLRDSQLSIPRGTVLAVFVTSSICSVEGILLRDKYGKSISNNGDLVLSLMAWPTKWIVLVGTLTATIGAGLQALAGGPRLLQAIAQDNIVPVLSFFAKKWHGEPIRSLLATFCIAELGILIAYLDYVAPIVTMFFLMCYGFINFAVTLQSLLDTPHWRPSFRCYHWSLTLFGSALCITVMFICNWIYAIIAITIMILLYHYIEYKGMEKEWGDGMTGLYMTTAIKALTKMKRDYKHTKNWRPQVLVLLKMRNVYDRQVSFTPEDQRLVTLADMLKAGKGLSIFASVYKGTLGDKSKIKRKLLQVIHTCLDEAKVKGFVEVVVNPSIADGICCMIQSAGIGALRPNTIILGWPLDWVYNRNIDSYHLFLDTMRNSAVSHNAVIVLKAKDFPLTSSRISGTIDIWWIVNDGGMLLLLTHLLRRGKVWSKSKLRLFSVAQEYDNTVQIKKDLELYLYQLRMHGTVEVVEMSEMDMSAYIYERTLKMEERTRLLQFLAKTHRKSGQPVHISSNKRILEKEAQTVLENARSAISILDNNSLRQEFEEQEKKLKSNENVLPSHENMRHMNTAVRLNSLMKEKSKDASLVILNLPCVPASCKGQTNYMTFLEVLTEGIPKCLLVRGTGKEVITVYN